MNRWRIGPSVQCTLRSHVLFNKVVLLLGCIRTSGPCSLIEFHKAQIRLSSPVGLGRSDRRDGQEQESQKKVEMASSAPKEKDKSSSSLSLLLLLLHYCYHFFFLAIRISPVESWNCFIYLKEMIIRISTVQVLVPKKVLQLSVLELGKSKLRFAFPILLKFVTS